MESSEKFNDKNCEYNCINWDKSCWLSSHRYFFDLTDYLVSLLNICTKSKVLDIGCGRGYLIEHLVKRFRFESKPIGIDPVDHLWRKNNIKFINSDANTFLSMHNSEFDFVFIKQVIHLIPYEKRQLLWVMLKKILATNGKIIVIQMSKDFNIPAFPLMQKKLIKSVSAHQEINTEIARTLKIISQKEYIFHVNILRDEYINLLRDRFLSILCDFTDEQIRLGSLWIEENYPSQISFEDRLDISIIGK